MLQLQCIGNLDQACPHVNGELLESVYEVILAYELKKRGLSVDRKVSIPIEYHGIKFDEGWNIKNN